MIIVVGVSHKTAPIDLREQLALSVEAAAELCQRLTQNVEVAEAFVVSTCNRVEIVAVPSEVTEPLACARVCTRLLCERHAQLEQYTYVQVGEDGMRHLVRVAASLDSLVVGEPQILGQLKAGFELARSQGTVGAILHRAFSLAVRGAKRVRRETSIGTGQVSVPSIAVQLAGQIFGDLRGHRVALLGSGDMGRAVANLFAEQGAKLTVLGRSLERVAAVTAELGGEAAMMDQLPRVLSEVDVVVSSTSSPAHVIALKELKRSLKARRGRNLFLIDLAVPRDIEPGIGQLDGVFLYNIDDLSQVATESAQARRREADRATALVEEVVLRWERAWQAELATPVIKALRSRMRHAFHVEMDKSLRGRLKGLDEEQRAALQKMIDAGVNRLLHAPTTQIREEAARGGGEAVDEVLAMLTDLFALGDLVSLDETDSLLPGEAPSGGESLTSAPEHAAPQETAGSRAVVKTPAPAQMGIDDEPNADEKASDSSPVACARARFSGA